MSLIHKLEHRFEELILLFLIFAAIGEFFRFLPGDFGFLKDIISWITVCYLVYKISPTRLLFNNKLHVMDVLIIISYVFFVAKNLTQLVVSTGTTKLFSPVALFIYNYYPILESYGLKLGGIIILLASLYLAKTMKIYKPSLIDFLKKKRKNFYADFFEKYAIIVLFLFAFFILVFNLIIEWLAWVIDTPLIIAGIALYIFIIIRHHKKFRADNFIFKIGNFGEGFYRKAIMLLHNKKTIFLALAGLLVLHTLTDVASFFIPYIFNTESSYFEGFDAEHNSLISSLLFQFSNSILNNVALVIVYIANYITILFFLIFPGYLWFKIFKNEMISSRWLFRMPFFISFVIALVLPVFKIVPFNSIDFTGVDFQTTTIEGSFSILKNFFTPQHSIIAALYIALVIAGLLVFLSSKQKKIPEIMDKLMIMASIAFLGYYIALYIYEMFKFYSRIVQFYMNVSIFSAGVLFIFSIISILFYFAAGWYFLHKIFVIEKHYKT